MKWRNSIFSFITIFIGFCFLLVFHYAATELTVVKILFKKIFMLTKTHSDC